MKLSSDHILTTHVGSLPRPHWVVELMVRKDTGVIPSMAMTGVRGLQC